MFNAITEHHRTIAVQVEQPHVTWEQALHSQPVMAGLGAYASAAVRMGAKVRCRVSTPVRCGMACPARLARPVWLAVCAMHPKLCHPCINSPRLLFLIYFSLAA